jgi:hypothetical protein
MRRARLSCLCVTWYRLRLCTDTRHCRQQRRHNVVCCKYHVSSARCDAWHGLRCCACYTARWRWCIVCCWCYCNCHRWHRYRWHRYRWHRYRWHRYSRGCGRQLWYHCCLWRCLCGAGWQLLQARSQCRRCRRRLYGPGAGGSMQGQPAAVHLRVPTPPPSVPRRGVLQGVCMCACVCLICVRGTDMPVGAPLVVRQGPAFVTRGALSDHAAGEGSAGLRQAPSASVSPDASSTSRGDVCCARHCLCECCRARADHFLSLPVHPYHACAAAASLSRMCWLMV